jgi:hypothetical protein
MQEGNIPVCPLISAGQDIPRLCEQEKCAWYIKAYKTCAVYVMGHNSALDIKLKQPSKG